MGCGSCVVSYAEAGDPADFYWDSKPVARREHVCSECRRVIQPGERYGRVTGKWDGEIQTYKTCFDCQSIIDFLFCDGVVFGEVRADLREHIAEGGTISEDCMIQLTPRARGMVCEIIEGFWADEDAENEEEVAE